MRLYTHTHTDILNNKKFENTKGITLIALVVTIVILIILAGISIAVLTGENGIINKTKKAKEETEISKEKEIIDISATQAMGTNRYGSINEIQLQEKIKSNIKGNVNIEKEDKNYIVTITSSGRKYLVQDNGEVRKIDWWKEKDKEGNNIITNGKKILTIGDFINYDANNNEEISYSAEASKTGADEKQTFSSNYNTDGWKLLGIEHKEDKDYFMIIPKTRIKSTQNVGLTLGGTIGYLNGVEEIENICKIYGNGKYSTGSRAMKVEDLNKITGYDPLNTGDGEIFRKGNVEEYNNDLTITEVGSRDIKIEGKNGANMTWTYVFSYFNDKKEFVKLGIGETIKLKCTYYAYYPTTLTDNSKGEKKGLDTSSKEYQMLFSNSWEHSYWLANQAQGAGGTNNIEGEGNTNECITLAYAIFHVKSDRIGFVGDQYLVYPGGNQKKLTYDIMPIVYLDSDINLKNIGTKDNCNQWEIKD